MSLEYNPKKAKQRAAVPSRPELPVAPKPAVRSAGPVLPPVLTLETLAYVVLFCLALATRLGALDAWPLSAAETEQSWAAWLVFRGARPDATGLSPLLVYGSALTFALMGAGDVTARLVPALAGSVLVVLPSLLRGSLGRAGALAASVLLLVSPSFLAFSRTLDGSILVAAGSMGMLGCGMAMLRSPSPGMTFGAVISAVVLVLGEGSALLPLAALATGAWLVWKSTSAAQRRDVSGMLARTRAWAWLAGLLALLGSGLLTNFGALRWGLVEAPFNWLAGLVQTVAGRPVTYYIGALLAYEPLVVLLAFIAGGRLAYLHLSSMRTDGEPVARPDFVLYLSGWAVLAVAVISIGATKQPSEILLALMPLILVAAWSLGWLAEQCGRERVLQTGGIGLAGTFVVMLVAAAAIANPVLLFGGRFETLERQLQIVQAAIVIILCAGIVAVCVWLVMRLGWRASALSLAMTSVCVLSVLGVHSAWTLAYQPGESETLAPESTSVVVRGLAADVAALSRFTGESAAVIQADPPLAYPLAWYLRDYKKVTWSPVTAPASAGIVVIAADGEKASSAFLAGYLGRRYGLATKWQETISPEASLWGWIANRTALGPVTQTNVVMYVRRAR